ncbi:MAG: formimidoylglutamase [Legionella longbeachae]|nr:formimidoylglutamase [Legionella longbeachae]
MFEHLSTYQQANPSLWQGRTDTANTERFFQKIIFPSQQTDLITKKKKTILLGFSSDVGVRRNQGRAGSKLGPDQIKMQLAKLPCALDKELLDLGNIVCEGDDLETAQDQFANLISFCHQQGHQTIAFGGGHEIAWPHYQGLASHYSKLGIINFDAHFDLRPYQKTQPGTSGTPFSQIAAYCKENNQDFNYCCLGIQKMGNTPSLFQRATDLGVSFLTAEEIYENSLAWHLAFLDEFMLNLDHIYLTICLDVFAESFAPGVSAPQPLGLTPWQVLPLLKYIIQSGKVISLDIAELSPPLDEEQKTARLAALIIAELLHTI